MPVQLTTDDSMMMFLTTFCPTHFDSSIHKFMLPKRRFWNVDSQDDGSMVIRHVGNNISAKYPRRIL